MHKMFDTLVVIASLALSFSVRAATLEDECLRALVAGPRAEAIRVEAKEDTRGSYAIHLGDQTVMTVQVEDEYMSLNWTGAYIHAADIHRFLNHIYTGRGVLASAIAVGLDGKIHYIEERSQTSFPHWRFRTLEAMMALRGGGISRLTYRILQDDPELNVLRVYLNDRGEESDLLLQIPRTAFRQQQVREAVALFIYETWGPLHGQEYAGLIVEKLGRTLQ